MAIIGLFIHSLSETGLLDSSIINTSKNDFILFEVITKIKLLFIFISDLKSNLNYFVNFHEKINPFLENLKTDSNNLFEVVKNDKIYESFILDNLCLNQVKKQIYCNEILSGALKQGYFKLL